MSGAAIARLWAAAAARCLALDRLALGADLGDHRPHEPDANPVGDLDLNLGIVRHLGDAADNPAGGHDRVAAPDALDQVLVLAGLALLRPDDQDPHDDENQD